MNSKKQAQQAAASRREQLRARQAAEAKAQQRKMRVIYVLCGVLAVAIIAVVGGVALKLNQDKKAAAEREANSQVRPPSAMADGTGMVANPGKFAKDAPVLTIYQDYQCPACKQTEDKYGAVIKQLAADGKIQLQYRTLTFLDTNLRNDSSFRAAMAAACSDTVGKLESYHDTVYANQPAQEGDGYTDDQLSKDFAQKAGITGADLTKFQTCYKDRQTSKWVTDSNLAAQKTWAGTTPQYDINGKNPKVDSASGQTDWWRVLDATPEAWEKAINDHK